LKTEHRIVLLYVNHSRLAIDRHTVDSPGPWNSDDFIATFVGDIVVAAIGSIISLPGCIIATGGGQHEDDYNT
jgi:hypothetical protein